MNNEFIIGYKFTTSSHTIGLACGIILSSSPTNKYSESHNVTIPLVANIIRYIIMYHPDPTQPNVLFGCITDNEYTDIHYWCKCLYFIHEFYGDYVWNINLNKVIDIRQLLYIQVCIIFVVFDQYICITFIYCIVAWIRITSYYGLAI